MYFWEELRPVYLPNTHGICFRLGVDDLIDTRLCGRLCLVFLSVQIWAVTTIRREAFDCSFYIPDCNCREGVGSCSLGGYLQICRFMVYGFGTAGCH